MNLLATSLAILLLMMQTLSPGLAVTFAASAVIKSTQDQKPPDSAAQSGKEIPFLEVGKPVDRELAGGQTQMYGLRIATGQLVRAIVEQRGIDVAIALFAPNGTPIIAVDSSNATQGDESFAVIVELSGIYQLGIQSRQKGAPTGRYKLVVAELREATAREKSQMMADTAFKQAQQLRGQRTKESALQAVEKYQESLRLFREAGDQKGEANALNNLGSIYSALGEKQKALDHYTAGLTIYSALGDRRSEAVALNNIGTTHDALGNKEKALESFGQALLLRRSIPDRSGEAKTLNNIGAVYKSMGRKQKALENFEQALQITRSLGELLNTAILLNNLGAVYDDLGEKQKALEYYQQILPIYRAFGDRSGELTTLNNIGKVHDDLGKKQQALDCYLEALRLERDVGDRRSEAMTLNNLGSVYNSIGEKQQALGYYRQALELQRAFGDRGGAAVTLSNIGTVHSRLGDKAKALEYYEQALTLHRAVEDRGGEAAVLNNIGTVYDDQGEKEKALGFYSKALPLTRAIGDRRGEARTLNNIGLIYDSMGKTKDALEVYFQALSLRRAVEDRRGEATTINNIGGAYDAVGDKRTALLRYEEALPLYRAVGDRDGEATTLNNVGGVYNSLGEKQKALDYYRRAQNLYHAISNRNGEATALNNIGGVNGDLGNKQTALSHYLQARSLYHAVGDRRGEAATLNNIGSLYNNLGNKLKALDYFSQALQLSRATQNRGGEATTLNNIGTVYGDLDKKQEALAYYRQSLPLHHAVGDIAAEATTLNNIGAAYDELGDKQQALNYYEQALPLRRASGDRMGEATTLNNIGLVFANQKETQRALDQYTQALELMRGVGSRGGEASTLSNIGVAYEEMADRPRALNSYQQAIAAFESIRATATIDELKIGIAEKAAATYERAAILLLDMGQPEEAFNTTERARARALLDQLGNAHPTPRRTAPTQLVDHEQKLVFKIRALNATLKSERARPQASQNAVFINSLETDIAYNRRLYEDLLTELKLRDTEYASLRNVQPSKLNEIRAQLKKDRSLISYFVTTEKTLAFIITRDSFHVVQIPVARDKLSATVSWFRHFDDTNEAHPESLRQLHDWLIVPLKPYLTTPDIGIVPDETLHYVPFVALTDGKTFLGDRYKLFYLPSASMLKFIREKGKVITGTKVLAISQRRAEGLAVLEYADTEAKTVARLFNTTAFLTGSMSKASFLNRAPDYNIIHIAAHAELNLSNPLFTRIVIGSDTNEADGGGDLEVKDVYDIDLYKTNLVVLSACETFLGKHSKGDDIIGLNRAFIYAGTPTVIASLWAVNDESSSYLMERFYARLKRGMNKVEALQAAQSDTRAKYPNPYYWSGFVLTGNPR